MGLRSFTKIEKKRIIEPLTKKLLTLKKKGTIVVGMQGGQGTGKTTIAGLLKKELERHGKKVVSFSLDDFYVSSVKRKELSKKYPTNPYFQIPRGMPGTHCVSCVDIVLKKAKRGADFCVPVFDKSKHQGHGDVVSKICFQNKIDFVIMEGWCVGMPNVSDRELSRINIKNKIKLIGTNKDRKVVLEFTKKYHSLWKKIDYMVMIKPDSSLIHKKWRLLQERRLKKVKSESMSKKEIVNFVDLFLPFTYLCYDKVKANLTIFVDNKHNYYKLVFHSRN